MARRTRYLAQQPVIADRAFIAITKLLEQADGSFKRIQGGVYIQVETTETRTAEEVTRDLLDIRETTVAFLGMIDAVLNAKQKPVATKQVKTAAAAK